MTLSFPPFVVVHVNDACCRMTGFVTHEILGKPLQNLFGMDCHKSLNQSVAIMHDQLAPVVSNTQPLGGGDKMLQCFVKITLVGPEQARINDQEHYGEAVEEDNGHQYNATDATVDDTELFVTHYGVELEPVGKKASGHTNVHLVSPEIGAYCGILG